MLRGTLRFWVVIIACSSACKIARGLDTVEVSTADEFYRAFTKQNVGVIALTTDVKMEQAEWAGFGAEDPYELSRSLILTSVGDIKQLDFNFVQHKCRCAYLLAACGGASCGQSSQDGSQQHTFAVLALYASMKAYARSSLHGH